MKKQESKYAYGWLNYASEKPVSDIVDQDGNKKYEKIRIYNATNANPEVALQINRKKYVFVPTPPEPDQSPDLKPGTMVLFYLTDQEIEKLIKDEIEYLEAGQPNTDGKLLAQPTKLSRNQRRNIKKTRTKYYKTKPVVKTITEQPTEE